MADKDVAEAASRRGRRVSLRTTRRRSRPIAGEGGGRPAAGEGGGHPRLATVVEAKAVAFCKQHGRGGDGGGHGPAADKEAEAVVPPQTRRRRERDGVADTWSAGTTVLQLGAHVRSRHDDGRGCTSRQRRSRRLRTRRRNYSASARRRQADR